MRTRKLAWNTIASLLFQITSLICGFILPRLILHNYGSEVNGLVNSITQFLQVIVLLEFGIGAVIQSTLYKPLAENDEVLVSKIIASGNKFFTRIAQILLVYVIVLTIVYPNISNQKFGYLYTTALIIAMSISSFAQYYFGIIDRILLTADQKGYIQYIAQIITLIVNTILCVILIMLGSSIHVVKLVTSIIFLVRPLVLRIYVNRHYKIDRKIEYKHEPIQQKWNGVAQHVAYYVLEGTDNIILTIFSTLSDVSIYSIYNLIMLGVKNLFISMTSGIQAVMGEMWAKQELKELSSFFGKIEWAIHLAVTLIFGCTLMLIVPFVKVYTLGITDVNYNVPIFAVVLTWANAIHCLRLPYKVLILAGGHYKQTQHNYIIAASLNLSISIILVMKWGLVGVAIGTLIAMSYQTIWMAYYDSKNLINWPFRNFLKQICVDTVTVLLGVVLTKGMEIGKISYSSWTILAIKTVCVWMSVVLIVNMIFYRNNVVNLLTRPRKK